MIETRHGLESNPVPTSILSNFGGKMDVGTGLDSRPCGSPLGMLAKGLGPRLAGGVSGDFTFGGGATQF